VASVIVRSFAGHVDDDVSNTGWGEATLIQISPWQAGGVAGGVQVLFTMIG
jgi:hypothetical protein